MAKRFTIDRFEGDKAVLEDDKGNTTTVSKKEVPRGSKGGDKLRFDNRKQRLIAAPREKAKKTKEIGKKLDELKKKTPKKEELKRMKEGSKEKEELKEKSMSGGKPIEKKKYW